MPTALSWVSLTAWFDRKAQEDKMTSERYARYRAKVYIVGIDVQRQEMPASSLRMTRAWPMREFVAESGR